METYFLFRIIKANEDRAINTAIVPPTLAPNLGEAMVNKVNVPIICAVIMTGFFWLENFWNIAAIAVQEAPTKTPIYSFPMP